MELMPNYFQLVCLLVWVQTIEPKGLKFSGFDGSHPGDVITKFSVDQFVR